MNSHNPLQNSLANLVTKKEDEMQYGLQRSWEQPEVLAQLAAKKLPPVEQEVKQNHFVKRGNRLYVLKKN
jgi:hypothetical protein